MSVNIGAFKQQGLWFVRCSVHGPLFEEDCIAIRAVNTALEHARDEHAHESFTVHFRFGRVAEKDERARSEAAEMLAQVREG